MSRETRTAAIGVWGVLEGANVKEPKFNVVAVKSRAVSAKAALLDRSKILSDKVRQRGKG